MLSGYGAAKEPWIDICIRWAAKELRSPNYYKSQDEQGWYVESGQVSGAPFRGGGQKIHIWMWLDPLELQKSTRNRRGRTGQIHKKPHPTRFSGGNLQWMQNILIADAFRKFCPPAAGLLLLKDSQMPNLKQLGGFPTKTRGERMGVPPNK